MSIWLGASHSVKCVVAVLGSFATSYLCLTFDLVPAFTDLVSFRVQDEGLAFASVLQGDADAFLRICPCEVDVEPGRFYELTEVCGDGIEFRHRFAASFVRFSVEDLTPRTLGKRKSAAPQAGFGLSLSELARLPTAAAEGGLICHQYNTGVDAARLKYRGVNPVHLDGDMGVAPIRCCPRTPTGS